MGTFEDALRERLNVINSVGEDQTTWQKLHNARLREKQQQDQAYSQQLAQYQAQIQQRSNVGQMQGGFGTTGGSGSFNYQGGNASMGDKFEQFKNSIANKESSGNYNARNGQTGAMGKYQIMPSNLMGAHTGWDYEALGYDVSTTQFMQSPEIQEKIASYKLQQYYNKYGPAGASIAWYAGPGAAQSYVNSGQVSKGAEAGGYPSVWEYMQAVTGGR